MTPTEEHKDDCPIGAAIKEAEAQEKDLAAKKKIVDLAISIRKLEKKIDEEDPPEHDGPLEALEQLTQDLNEALDALL